MKNINFGLFTILGILLFVFISGCTVKQNATIGCCVIDTTNPNSPTCKSLKGTTSAGIALVNTNSCNTNLGTCNITIGITPQTGSQSGVNTQDNNYQTTTVNAPICSNRAFTCISDSCFAQVCGPFKYQPQPVPSLSDTVTFSKSGSSSYSFNSNRAPLSINLYGTTCLVVPANETLKNVLENSKGSAVNIFRFGIGNTFEEFETYRYLFPFTDTACNINTFSTNVKDRYLNYMLSPTEFQNMKSDSGRLSGSGWRNTGTGGAPVQVTYPWQRVATDNFCPQTTVSPFLGSINNFKGSDGINYKFNSSVWSSVYQPSIRNPPTQSPPSTFSRALDKTFYRNFLPLIYEDDMAQGITSASGPVPAPFECSSPIECSSGYCNFVDYSRNLCKKTSGSSTTWVECGCNSLGLSCFGGTTTFSYLPGVGKPNSAADLNAYINAYTSANLNDPNSQPQDFYSKNNPILTLNYAGVQPSCSGFLTSLVAGVQIVEDQGTCVIADDGIATCTLSAGYNGNDEQTESLTSRGPATVRVKNLNSFSFPKGIQLFGEIKTGGYVGYTLLSEQQLQASDFGRRCGPLTNGVDYVIKQPNKIQYGRNTGQPSDYEEPDSNGPVSNAYAVGTIIRPPPAQETSPPAWLNSDDSTFADVILFTGAQSLKTSPSSCDDEGGWDHYIYAQQYIFLKANNGKIGTCDLDSNSPGLPVTKSFGWCEACSYATLSKQIVTSSAAAYNPSAITYSRNFENPQTQTKVTPLLSNGNPTKYRSAVSNPVEPYLEQKQDKYLQEGVLPVFDLSDQGNWVSKTAMLNPQDPSQSASDGALISANLFSNYMDAYPYIKNNVGPSMVIVGNISLSQLSGSSLQSSIVFRHVRRTSAQTIYELQVEGVGPNFIFDETRNTVSNPNPPVDTRSSTQIENIPVGNYIYKIQVDKSVTVVPCLSGPPKPYTESFNVQINILDLNNNQVSPTINRPIPVSIPNNCPIVALTGPSTTVQIPVVPFLTIFKERIDSAKLACSKCLLGFRILNNNLQGSTRRVADIATLNAVDAYDLSQKSDTTKTILDKIDFVAYSFYPDEYTQEDNSLCGSTANNQNIISQLENLSRTTLYDSGKLSLISDFSINSADSLCWSDAQKQNFISYMLTKQRTLSSAGLMGVIYSDVSGLKSGGTPYTNTNAFCDLNSGSKSFVADPPVTVYTKIYTSPSVTCEECNELDYTLGKCNSADTSPVPRSELCDNNVACTLPNSATRSPTTQFKCPEKTIPDPCVPCSSVQNSLDCKIYRSDGTVNQVPYDINTLNDLSADVIASIPRQTNSVCCLLETNSQASSGAAGGVQQPATRSYTYVKQTAAGRNVAPIVFSVSGDPADDCGIPDSSSIGSNICGSATPIKNYQISCTLVDNSAVVNPLAGGSGTGVINPAGGGSPPTPGPGGGGGIISPGAGGSGGSSGNAGGSGGN